MRCLITETASKGRAVYAAEWLGALQVPCIGVFRKTAECVLHAEEAVVMTSATLSALKLHCL